jgi:hypothetical protein
MERKKTTSTEIENTLFITIFLLKKFPFIGSPKGKILVIVPICQGFKEI